MAADQLDTTSAETAVGELPNDAGVVSALEKTNSGLLNVAGSLLSAAAAFSLMLRMGFVEVFSSIWLTVALMAILFLATAIRPTWRFPKEAACYAVFILYMFTQLLWTPDPRLAFNTISPAIAFLLALVLFSTLVTSYPKRTVIKGALFGGLAGAVLYTVSSGFPLSYPEAFSYNAVALGYVFCLFLVFALGLMIRSPILLTGLAIVIVGHIFATTSIKANLGLAVALLVSFAFYFRSLVTILYRNLAILAAIAFSLVAVVVTNASLMQVIERGAYRVSLGVELLLVRDDIAGYGGYSKRRDWLDRGIEGWSESPVFGHGVEAFRSRYDITSHSTPVDLLYNSGLIGLLLFYGVFAFALRRLGRARNAYDRRIEAVFFGAITFIGFVSLSGVFHYNAFVAAILGISVGLLSRPEGAAVDVFPNGLESPAHEVAGP